MSPEDLALTPKTPIEVFRQKMADAVTARLYAPSSAWRYDHSETVYLGDTDVDKVQGLIFGRRFEIEDAWQELNSDYYYDRDKEAIKEALEQELKANRDELQALADDLGEDPDDLVAPWLEDDDEGFEVSDILDGGLHTESYDYRGQRALYAELPFWLCVDPVKPELWQCLHALRIPPLDFLASALKHIESASEAEAGFVAPKNEEALSVWGLELPDSDAPAQPAQLAAAMYEANFRENLQMVQNARAIALGVSTEGPVIEAEHLIGLVLDGAYGSQTVVPAYLHMAAGSTLVDGVGLAAARHDLLQDGVYLRARTGYISTDPSPGEHDHTYELKAPLDVAQQTFQVANESPYRRTDDALELPAHLQLMADLYEVAFVSREHSRGTDPFDPGASDAASTITKVLAILATAPDWAIEHVRGNHTWCQNYLTSYLASRGLAEQEALDGELLQAIEQGVNVERPLASGASADLWSRVEALLALGARADMPNAQGATAFQVASANLFPMDRIAQLHASTSQKATQGGRADTFALVLRALKSTGQPSSEHAAESFRARIIWYLNTGIGPDGNCASDLRQGPFHDLLVLGFPDLVGSTMDALQEAHPNVDTGPLKQALLKEAVFRLEPVLLSAMLARGADPDCLPRSFMPDAQQSLEAAAEASTLSAADQRRQACRDVLLAFRRRRSAMALIDDLADVNACVPALGF